MVSLSVVILTQNEQDNISRCLTSVSFADDILMIDNSSDNTVKIAKKTIASKFLHIYKNNTINNFSYLRNFGLDKAKNKWVLFLDADEEMSPKLMSEIILNISKTEAKGFYLKRQDFFMGKLLQHGETGNIKLLKLGLKNAGLWHRKVHEVWRIKGEIGILKAPIFHYPHPTIAEFTSRINRWTTLDTREFYENGVSSSWWKIIAYPVGKFFLNYFVRSGLLDGIPGLFYAIMMSFHSFLTRSKLYILTSNNGINEPKS